MGFLTSTRGRNDTRIVQGITGSDLHGLKYEVNVSANNSNESNRSNDIEQVSVETVPEKPPQRNSHRTTQGAYIGVQKAEAAALAWSKKSAYGTFALIWVCFFILALQSSISSNVIQRAYSEFRAAPQVSTANILSSVVSGVIKLPVARMLNVWGRTEGFLVFVGVYMLGLVILAACNNPNSYAAGYVLYWVGYDAIYLVLDVFVADTSGLRNRAFAFGFASTPFICTAFTGPIAAQSFLRHTSWRWAYGAFAIITPFVFLPLAAVFKFYQRKAERMCLFVREPHGRTKMESVIHYIKEFDLIGSFLLMAAFLLVLLPFSLQSYGRAEYKSASFIALLVIGFCVFFVFAAWEKYGASKHFIQYELFKERTVLGACFLYAFLFFSYYCWDLYFYNFCMVVYNLPVSLAGYIGQIYNVGSCLWSAIFGIIVYITKQFKYTCLGFGLPLILLGAGLMIHFRVPGEDLGYMIMCQIFIAFAGGTLTIGSDMAVMAAADREGVPMMLSMVGLFSSLGGAMGYAVSASIYSNIFPPALHRSLPEDKMDQLQKIYTGGYVEQKKFDLGTPTRDAINYAWSEYMKYSCITAVAVMSLGIPAIAVWRNYRVDNTKQNKGQVM